LDNYLSAIRVREDCSIYLGDWKGFYVYEAQAENSKWSRDIDETVHKLRLELKTLGFLTSPDAERTLQNAEMSPAPVLNPIGL